EKFKKWLAVPDPSINHNIAREKHHEGTCQWLLDDKRYISWKEQSNSFMWINGISGCGKTLICSTIIEDIKDIAQDHPGTGLAYFYFDINDKMKQTSRSLLSSLVLSLTAKSKDFLLLEKLYDKHDQLHKPTKSELLHLLMKLLQLFQQAYIVIDALDECDDYYQLFVQVVKIIYEWQLPHFHLLVSSRREQHIITSMGECGPAEICLSAELVERDVISYICSVVKEDHRLKRWSDIVQQDIKNALITVLIQTLKSLPKDLETTYDQILQRIHEKEMSSAKVILLWLALGMRPFTQEQLAIVVTFDPLNNTFDSRLGLPCPDDVLQVCSSLIMKTSYNTVKLAHATVREYLINKPEKIGLSGLEAGHASIAHFCLSYLLYSGWKTEKNEFPLLQYSAQLWPDHYKLSSKDETLQKTVIMFFQSENETFNKWIEIYHDKGANVNAQGGEYGNALQSASQNGHAKTVSLLLHKGADVNAQGGFYGNALQAAVYNGHTEIVRLLLDKGDVDVQGGRYGSALQVASDKGHAEIVKLLLNKGTNVNAQGGGYGNALQAASYKGYAKIVILLLDKGANVNTQGGEYGNALQSASYNGHAKIVSLLLEEQACVNAQGGRYGNALQAASYKGHAKIVRLLLDKGANVNAEGGEYGNALQAASHEGHAGIIRLLLDKGADVNAQGGKYGNALQATSSEGHAEIVRLLLDEGADVNGLDGKYGNALQAASHKGHAEIARLLLDKGANVNAQGGLYGNALQAALCNGNAELIRLLLDKGADVNAQGGFYGNILQAASCNGNVEIARLLLDEGADVNAQGGFYGNALQAASCNGNAELVRLLLDKGA
ncbi:ankyrin repeat-containing domain protein, partial [Amanita rubescens]